MLSWLLPTREGTDDDESEGLDILPEDINRIWTHPEDVPRRCTDLPWLVSFIMLLCALLVACLWHRSVTPLLRLSDYNGRVCGASGARDAPFAYVCSIDNGEFQTAFAVCLRSCPLSNRTEHRCYNHQLGVDAEVRDYPTETMPLFLSNLCAPQSMELANQLFAYHAREAEEVRIYVVLRRLCIPLLLAALTGILIAYSYLWILKKHAAALSTIGVNIIVLVPRLGLQADMFVHAGHMCFSGTKGGRNF